MLILSISINLYC